jgi:alpha-mannosidase
MGKKRGDELHSGSLLAGFVTPIKGPLSFYCHFIFHSHIDAVWLWPVESTIEACHKTFKSILHLMKRYPNLHFSQSSAQYYKWMEEKYPKIFEEIKRRVKEGRWEIVGGMWVEPDCNMPSGESLVRQFLYGKNYFKEKFGVDVKIAWLVDSFGYPWTLPQICKKSGVQYFLTQKLNWNDTTVFPYNIFYWSSPDGSSIITHQTVGSYNEPATEERILQQLMALKARHRIGDLLIICGRGDHGGDLISFKEILKRVNRVIGGEKIHKLPELMVPAHVKGKFSTAKNYFDLLTKLDAEENFPEFKDELYLQYHRGSYTTQADVKKNNRKAECLLEVAEKFSTVAQQYGFEYPRDELNKAWRKLLFYQNHDYLSGTCIPQVYEDAKKDFKQIFSTIKSIISKSVETVAAEVGTLGKGVSLLIFNPLSWARTDKVEVPLDKLGNSEAIEIRDDGGRLIPSQIVEEGEKKVIFIAETVPSIGYKEYRAVLANRTKKIRTALFATQNGESIKLENEYYAVEVDKKTGLIKTIYDKINKKEILQEGGNQIQIFEDHPTGGRTSISSPFGDAAIFDAWEIFAYQQPGGIVCTELTEPREVQLLESGPVRGRIQIKYKYCQKRRPDSTVISEVILYCKIPLIEFRLYTDWHAEHRLAKVAFPLNVRSDFTTYEVPYGFITRRNPFSPKATLPERAKYEVPGQKWIDHTSEDGSYGVSLLNDSKYGFDTINDTVRMTLLRSPIYPSMSQITAQMVGAPPPNVKLTDQGEHSVKYALYPHKYDYRKALTAKKAYEFNYPLIAHVEPNHGGALPKIHSFIAADPDNVILTVVKKAESSEDVIIRLYESAGDDTEALIYSHKTPLSAQETDMQENIISKLPIHKNVIKIPIGKHEIKTIKCEFSHSEIF